MLQLRKLRNPIRAWPQRRPLRAKPVLRPSCPALLRIPPTSQSRPPQMVRLRLCRHPLRRRGRHRRTKLSQLPPPRLQRPRQSPQPGPQPRQSLRSVAAPTLPHPRPPSFPRPPSRLTPGPQTILTPLSRWHQRRRSQARPPLIGLPRSYPPPWLRAEQALRRQHQVGVPSAAPTSPFSGGLACFSW